ncbi:DNA cytosine methyltransferase [Rhizobium leguminosarum]|uniref:DNA cytosine methyltransferase n=1 Tax=Rhizobium leguminosarum TaxID=384 RepID=UPI00103C2378|nr:DNA (cytosine-5-)-methyltransferase [Rhizobium leguminosarum]TBY27432.1 DNA (cytosine-5-)-methyltransferase [Rhizobium leguminosarum bv. viciae]
MNAKADALSQAKKRIESLQAQMTDRVLGMAAEIEILMEHATPREARHFLRTSCGLATSDLSVYVKFSSTLKGAEAALRNARVPFAVMKALVGLDEDTRAEALTSIAGGAHLDTKDIGLLRKRSRLERLSRLEKQELERKADIAAAARKGLKSSLASLDREAEQFIGGVTRFAKTYKHLVLYSDPLASGEYLDAFGSICSDAARILRLFESLFGNEIDEAEDRRMSRAHRSLTRFAKGTFSHDGGFGFDASIKDFVYFDLIGALRVLTKRPKQPTWFYDETARSTTGLTAIPKRLRSLELCAGLGGLALGMESAGFEPAALIEINRDAAATLKLNRPHWEVIQDDVTKVDYSRYAGKIELLTGGIPCQPYSRSGDRLGKNDPRDLFPAAVKIVAEVKPKAFMFENVDGFVDAIHADHRAEIFAGFADAGYVTRIVSLNAKDFGIAQERGRVLIIGMRPEDMARFRPPETFPEWRVTIGDALEDLMAEGGWSGAHAWADRRRTQVIERNGKFEIGALASTILGEKRTAREKEAARWALREIMIGRTWEHPPTDEMALAHGEGFMPGLTMKMKLRLMGLPDDWILVGSEASQSQQVGNAVVPRMAQAVALSIYAALRGVDFDLAAMLLQHPLPYERRHITDAPPLSPDLSLEVGELLDA